MGIIHWSLGQFWFLLRRPAFCGLLSSFVCYFFWCGGFAKIGHSLAWYLGGASPGFGSVDDHQRRGCLITLGGHPQGRSGFVTRVTEGRLRGEGPDGRVSHSLPVLSRCPSSASQPGGAHKNIGGWNQAGVTRETASRADSEETRAGTTAQNLA